VGIVSIAVVGKGSYFSFGNGFLKKDILREG